MTAPARQLGLDLGRTPSYAREDFVVSASNRAAVEAIDAWPLWPGGKLALTGPAGSGKTHLARAWAARTGASIDQAGNQALPHPGPGPILLEDVDRGVDEDRLFHLMNMTDTGATLLITGRSDPATWSVRLADLRSRLNALTVASIQSPDDAVLLAVMKKLFSERNIKPKGGVGAYVIRRVERSVPAVQEIVRKIDEFAAAERREVTRALVAHILRQGI